jgi:hypothetical protein
MPRELLSEHQPELDLRFIEMFKASGYEDVSLSHMPPELVMAHLNIDKIMYDAIPKENRSWCRASGPIFHSACERPVP